MEQFTEMLATYATKEVLTVLAALGVAWAGWKAASKTWGIASGFAQKASFMGITAGVLLLAGLGVTGLGVGELSSRGSNDNEVTRAAQIEEASRPGFKNDQLLKLLTADNNVSTELTRQILDYARNRDGVLPDQKLLELAEKNPEALTALIELMKAREERVSRQYEYARSQNHQASESVRLTSYDGEGTSAASIENQFNLVEADQATIKNADSLMSRPMAWLCILLGIGASGSGVTCFFCRNSKRNPDDPHYPSRVA